MSHLMAGSSSLSRDERQRKFVLEVFQNNKNFLKESAGPEGEYSR